MPEPNGDIARDPTEWISKDLVRSLAEAVPDHTIILLDAEGRVMSWNNRVEKSIGYKAEEIIGQPFELFFLPEDVQAGEPELELKRAAAEGWSETAAWRRRKDGSHYWARVTLTAIRNQEGALLGFAKVTRDLSEQKKVEGLLLNMRAQLDRYRVMAENVEEYAIYTLDSEGKVNSWSASAQKVIGFRQEEVLGQHYSFFFTPEDVAAGAPQRALDEAASTGRCLLEGWRKTRSGAVDWVNGELSALRDESGRLTGFIRIAHSATKQKTLEESLRRLAGELESRVAERTRQLESTIAELRQKNEEVEAFVYIVSHDLRAPLVNVLGFVQELQMSCAAMKHLLEARQLPADLKDQLNAVMDEEIAGALNFIASSSQKFERLINALVRLSRQGRQVYQRVRVDMNSVAATAVAELKAVIEEAGAEVRILQLPPCFGDANALGQIVSILIANAVKYRDPRRALRIEVGGAEEEGLAHYWVRDNGLGIPEAGKSRLFQVFQRLHPQQGPGEGMGLAIAHRIIERHGGKIWAESHEGRETTFHLTLPHRTPSPALGEQP